MHVNSYCSWRKKTIRHIELWCERTIQMNIDLKNCNLEKCSHTGRYFKKITPGTVVRGLEDYIVWSTAQLLSSDLGDQPQAPTRQPRDHLSRALRPKGTRQGASCLTIFFCKTIFNHKWTLSICRALYVQKESVKTHLCCCLANCVILNLKDKSNNKQIKQHLICSTSFLKIFICCIEDGYIQKRRQRSSLLFGG